MKLLQYLWLLIQAIQLCHCESATKCNNITQYFMFSRCCAKCPPGTYLISKCTIQKDTECNRCEEGLYQSKWNLADHCQQHTYCDPNGGFVRELPGDTLRDAVCLCAIGKHCINKDCEMCAEDKNCKPGFGVDNPADRKHRDTECKECQSGFYSNVSSPVERCWKWTNCGSQGELKPGNSTTDVKCKPWPVSVPDETPTIVISVLVTAALVALVAAFIYHRDYLKEMLWRFHKQLKKPERHAVGKVNGATVILLEENWRVGEQASEETSVPIPESLAEVQSLFIAQQEDGKESHLPEQEQAPLSKS
ncbi:tumor necrosis factor receptor superfamily member 5-like isoform X1 [Carcharodon carcharias]|uniref:tumor necrosis factor receptor superfamily member 5-like isoform X1 n=1 Tax=Carcharodon carcharias TaxID=13397 RepID=UPI001B7E72B0|nr:tumor necrosis factor receptor superfamily member 5-like isoform X1 [Carcharodon carcharias]